MSNCTMIVLAAGRGERFGGPLPKQYLPLGNRPLLWHTLSRLHHHAQIDKIIPVIAPDGEDLWQRLMQPLLTDLPKVAAPVLGGRQRQHSVFNALRTLALADDAWIGIHDGARPLVDGALLDRLLEARNRGDAIIPALTASDTVKQVDPHGQIVTTLNRDSICFVQTPQLFRFRLIREAHQQAADDHFIGTDDASLVERLSHPVWVVPGGAHNIKITHPVDQTWAAWQLQGEKSNMRIGQGVDVHRWSTGRPLFLGGVAIPHEQGLLGHSDADVLLHAIMDALLGGAGLGDIGHHFPDTDPTYRGIDSRELLKSVQETLHTHHWTVVNLDATVICQKPKLAPYMPAMRQEIARLLKIAPEQVNIKATTTEGLGFTGRNEGVAAQAVVLLTAFP